MELEPREIADQMFQAGHISICEHDYVTDLKQKYKRLKSLLDVLKSKNLYVSFECTLRSLKYISVLDVLHKDRRLKMNHCEYFLLLFLN